MPTRVVDTGAVPIGQTETGESKLNCPTCTCQTGKTKFKSWKH